MNMSYQQVYDILSRIRAVHRRLRDDLERARPDAEDERTRFVLESIRRDEQAMNLALGSSQQEQGDLPLQTWIQYVPDEDSQRLLNETNFTEDMGPEEVVARKVEIDESLVSLYRRLAEQSSAPSVREFFERLAERTTQRLNDETWQIRDSESAPARDQPPP